MIENRKIVTIHQPETLPWLGFFNKMMSADEYIILDTVDFRKNYFQNRNQILTKQGPIYLTIPVESSNHKPIREIRIDNRQTWRSKHIKTLRLAYSKASFYHEISAFLEDHYARSFEMLIDFNLGVITHLRGLLEIQTPIRLASETQISESSTDLLLELCKEAGADIYLSGKDGAAYLDAAKFESKGIGVVFQNFRHPEYSQTNSPTFVPYMSTIDLIANHGKDEAKRIIKSGYGIHEEIQLR